MARWRTYASVLVSLAGLLGLPAEASTIRIGMVVGNNRGLGHELPLQFAESDARRMRDLLAEIGGFEPDRIVLLLGRDQDELRDALQQVRGRIAEASARGDEAMLLFYFSGHGSGGNLHLANSKLDVAALREELKATGASVVVGIIDACHSGRIGRSKGGVLDAAFDVTLYQEPTPRGMVLIASSLDDELSQESIELHGSLFTHYLISALRGEADYDADGRVSIREAYHSAYNHTLAKSVTTSSRPQHPFVDIDISGKGELILTFLRKSSAEIKFPATSSGRYLIVESHSGWVAAEVSKEAGREVSISLPSGGYQVFKQQADQYLACDVNLVWGGERRVDDASMKRFSYQMVAQKGLVRRLRSNRLLLYGEVVDSLLPGMQVWVTGGLGYERFLTPNLSLGSALSYTQQSFTFQPKENYLALRIKHREMRARLFLAYRFLNRQMLPYLVPSLGILCEYAHGFQEQMVQDQPDYQDNKNFHMFGLGPQLGLEVKLPGQWTVMLWGRAMLAWTFFPYNLVERTRPLELIATPSNSEQNIIFWSAGLGLAWDF